MPAQSIYALVTNNPPVLGRIIAETNKRTWEGERKIDKKTFRGIALGLNGKYDNQSADEAFNFLREHEVLVKDEASGQFIFDPIKAAGLLAASVRQDADAAMAAARERLAAKNKPSQDLGQAAVIQESKSSETSSTPPSKQSETAQTAEQNFPFELINDRLTRLETSIRHTKNHFQDLRTSVS